MKDKGTANGYVLYFQYPQYGIETNSLWVPLECGAKLKRDKIGESLYDCQGDSISEWNQLYSENTGIYWVWKNRKSDYVVFNQYRRRWGVIKPEFNFDKFFEDYDAMATPCLVPNSVAWQFQFFHKKENYDLLKEIVFEMYPTYMKDWEKHIEGSQLLYYSNGMALRWKDFDNYCNFLFSVLDEFKKRKGWDTPDAEYPHLLFGYISERLFTLWLKHRFVETKILKLPYDRLENTLL